MPVMWNPESEYAKELAKWEGVPRPWTNPDAPLQKPYRFEPYPKMLYKGRKREDGRLMVLDDRVAIGDARIESEALRWNQTTTCLVHSDAEAERATRDGWSETPQAAYDALEACERAIADAAAEANWGAARMSARAQDELRQVNDETAAHVTDVTPNTLQAMRDRMAQTRARKAAKGSDQP